MDKNREINLDIPLLTRVEGEGGLEIKARNGKIDRLKLNIFEPPRLFEKFLQGREVGDIIDVVSRICGICPVAYQMSAVQAIEDAFNLSPDMWIRNMRRLMYCGEWIESHSLHIHLLAVPDFLGYSNALDMAKDYPTEVKRGLALQGLGNRIIKLFGGRSVNPVGVKIGGFHYIPTHAEFKDLLNSLKTSLQNARDLVLWVASLDLPEHCLDFVSVSMQHQSEYPMNDGNIVTDNGLIISIMDFQKYFIETQVPHSTAFHSHLNNRPYLVGPLARMNLNWKYLHEPVKDVLASAGIGFPNKNMFNSVIVRAAEIYYSILEAIRLIELPSNISENPVPKVKSSIGYGCTEAPRGLLWHCYEFSESGHVIKAIIIPPTSQNQAQIESDIKQSLMQFGLENENHKIQSYAEKIVRNYDPCISCATHFLNLKLIRN